MNKQFTFFCKENESISISFEISENGDLELEVEGYSERTSLTLDSFDRGRLVGILEK